MKEKRRRLKPLLARLHREFNISAAEMDRLDSWQESILECAQVSNDPAYTQRTLQNIAHWVGTSWPDVILVDEQIELLH